LVYSKCCLIIKFFFKNRLLNGFIKPQIVSELIFFKKKLKFHQHFTLLIRYAFMDPYSDFDEDGICYNEFIELLLFDYSSRQYYQFHISPDYDNPYSDERVIFILQPEPRPDEHAYYDTFFLKPVYDTNSTFVCFSQGPIEYHR